MNVVSLSPSTDHMLTTPVIVQDVVYSDLYFKFGQCLTGMVLSLSVVGLNIISLPVSQEKKPMHQYMPIFNSLRLKYGIYPGILIFENQNHISKVNKLRDSLFRQQLLPVIKCIVPNYALNVMSHGLWTKENVNLDHELSPVESQVTSIVHRDTRNLIARVPFTGKLVLREMARKYSAVDFSTSHIKPIHRKDESILVRDEEETHPLLPLSPGFSIRKDHEFERRVHEGITEACTNSSDSKRSSLSKSCSSYSLTFSSSKTKSKGGFQMLDTSDDYEMLPKSCSLEIHETLTSSIYLKEKENESVKSYVNQKTLTIPEDCVSKYGHVPSSNSSTIVQESSFSSIEPYPLPEAPSLLLLEPLLLMQQDIADGRRNVQPKKQRRRKEQLTRSEQQKVARIMIGYTLAFFLLAIVTFYVVYFV